MEDETSCLVKEESCIKLPNVLAVQTMIEFFISRIGLHVSFVERESTYDFFNTLALIERNPILHKLNTDTQYVFGLQQISKSFIDLLCFSHNQDVVNIDEKQNFVFNHQAWFFWTDFESNGFQEI
jgi:hypothetical protein